LLRVLQSEDCWSIEGWTICEEHISRALINPLVPSLTVHIRQWSRNYSWLFHGIGGGTWGRDWLLWNQMINAVPCFTIDLMVRQFLKTLSLYVFFSFSQVQHPCGEPKLVSLYTSQITLCWGPLVNFRDHLHRLIVMIEWTSISSDPRGLRRLKIENIRAIIFEVAARNNLR
jgi:hypothetical protein